MLLQKISQGDEGAFSTLFEQYRNHLFTFLFSITKSVESSEEIVLDVFMKIWHARQLIPQIENFDAFLYKVAKNKAIDFLRSLKRNPVLQQEVWDLKLEPISPEDADTKLLFKGAETIISKAIGELSPQRKKVFYLHHYNGLTKDQIATRLQISKNTVTNHLSTSLEFVRKFISTNYDFLFFLFLLKN